MKRGNPILLLATVCIGLLLVARWMDYRDQEPPSGKKVITYMSMYANGEPFQQVLQEVFEEFEQAFPQYQVKPLWEGRWNISKARTRILVNHPPDIIDQSRTELAILLTSHLVMPLNEILKKEKAWNHSLGNISWEESFIPSVLNSFREENGDIFIVPREVYPQVIFYNQAQFEKLNLKIPSTLKEWIAMGEPLRKAGISPIGIDGGVYKEAYFDMLCLHYAGSEKYLASLRGIGAPWDDPVYIRAMERLIEIRRNLDENYRGYLWPAAQRDWAGGNKSCFFLCGTWLPNEIRNYRNNDPKMFKLAAMPFPSAEDGKVNQKIMTLIPFGFAIPKGAANKEGAIALLRFLTSQRTTEKFSTLNLIPVIKNAPFPEELKGIQSAIEQSTEIYSKEMKEVSPAWSKFVFQDLYLKFFMNREETISAEQFCRDLQQKTEVWRKEEKQRKEGR